MIRLLLFTYLISTIINTPGAAINFQCRFATGGFAAIGGVYFCSPSSLKTTAHSEVLTGSSGDHLVGYDNDGVRGLNIVGQICNFLPLNMNTTFGHLEAIQVQNSGLQQITKNDLSGFPKLRGLWLRENSLTVLEKDLFIYNRNLEYIQLNDNKIMHIDADLLNALPNVNVANLAFNYCINVNAVNRQQVMQLHSYFKGDCQDETVVLIRRL